VSAVPQQLFFKPPEDAIPLQEVGFRGAGALRAARSISNPSDSNNRPLQSRPASRGGRCLSR